MIHKLNTVMLITKQNLAMQTYRDCVGSKKHKKIPWLLIRELTIPTEIPKLVGEVGVNFSVRGVSRGKRNG
jgi:hypothetical protein